MTDLLGQTVLGGEASVVELDVRFERPEGVTDLALLLAGLTNEGPSGQTFGLMGRLM